MALCLKRLSPSQEKVTVVHQVSSAAPVSYDPHQFRIQTYTFQQQAYDAAIAKATEMARTQKDILAHVRTIRICDEAFEAFKTNLQTTFPSDEYKDLVFLTLKSRETLFFVKLKEALLSILKKQGPTDPSKVPEGVDNTKTI